MFPNDNEKKILILANEPTHPCTSGSRQCIMQYALNLRSLGFDVYFLLVETMWMVQDEIKDTHEHWGDYFLHYKTPEWQIILQKAFRKIAREKFPDIMDFWYPVGLNSYINRMHKKIGFTGMIANYVWLSWTAKCDIPVNAIFTHDIFTDRRKNIPNQIWHSYSMKNERKALRRFQNILAIQDAECDFFKSLAPGSNVVSVYSSFEYVPQPVTHCKNILFFSGGWQLNFNGITHFINDVFPLILEQEPEAKLLIGGKICALLEEIPLHPNIELRGLYDNPDDFYALGDISINPVYEGSGLKIKTMESIAHGKYTVVDPHDAIGIYKPEEAPLYVASTAREFADFITQAFRKPSLLEENEKKCRRYIDMLNSYILGQYSRMFSQTEDTGK